MTFFALNALARERFGADALKANASAYMELVGARSKAVRTAADMVSNRGAEADFSPEAFLADFAKYLDGCPLSYLTGETVFCGVRLRVEPGTLAPREETQLLCTTLGEIVLADGGVGVILDLCTGGGCVALGLGAALPGCEVVGVDNDPAAVALANANRARLGLTRVSFARADFLEALRAHAGKADYVACNPPYVDAADPELDPGVLRYEPRAAVIAPAGGYAFYEAFADFFDQSAWSPRAICFEIGRRQAPRLAARFARGRLRAYNLRALRDAHGNDRVLALTPRKGG